MADSKVVLVRGRYRWFNYQHDYLTIIKPLPKRYSPIPRMTLNCIEHLVFHKWEEKNTEIMRDPTASKTTLQDDLVVRAKLLVKL